MNLQEFEDTLIGMGERSRAYHMVKRELTKRGHWKSKPRGVPILTNLMKQTRQSTAASTHVVKPNQVTAQVDWSEAAQ